jgi:hypothetical protein
MTLDHLLSALDRLRETQLGQTGALRDIAETMQLLAQQNARYGQELRMLRREQIALRGTLAQINLVSSSRGKRGKSLWSVLLEAGEQRVMKWLVIVLGATYLAKGGDPGTLMQWALKLL